MKIVDLLEGREAPLYHGMSSVKASEVFKNDRMPARWTHQLPNLKNVQGNSFSRNKLLRYGYVNLVLDQALLAQTHKIIPLDADYIHHNKNNWDKPVNIKDRSIGTDVALRGGVTGPEHTQAEEFVLGDIEPLHKYIRGIIIDEPAGGTEVLKSAQLLNLVTLSKSYAEKFNIPLTVSPKIQKMFVVPSKPVTGGITSLKQVGDKLTAWLEWNYTDEHGRGQEAKYMKRDLGSLSSILQVKSSIPALQSALDRIHLTFDYLEGRAGKFKDPLLTLNLEEWDYSNYDLLSSYLVRVLKKVT